MQVKMINDRPVKIWADEVEDSAMEQIANLTMLPFLYHHLAIMPDVHTGKGMPIGGVLACVNAVIPNAVGVDIGCGMCAVKTNWHVADISTEVLRKRIMRGIRKRIPLGKNHHKLAQDESLLPQGHDIDKLEIVKTPPSSHTEGDWHAWRRQPLHRTAKGRGGPAMDNDSLGLAQPGQAGGRLLQPKGCHAQQAMVLSSVAQHWTALLACAHA